MTIGKTIEKYGVAPVIIDSRTFVPVRFVADELGATTAWNAETKTVTITKAVTPMKSETVNAFFGNKQIKKPAVENQLLAYFYGDGGI